jgi:hypothetical protein
VRSRQSTVPAPPGYRFARTAALSARPELYASSRRRRVSITGLLCDPCWRLPEVGFEAHRPSENLQLRLTATIPVHVTEVRGWLRTEAGRPPLKTRGQ